MSTMLVQRLPGIMDFVTYVGARKAVLAATAECPLVVVATVFITARISRFSDLISARSDYNR